MQLSPRIAALLIATNILLLIGMIALPAYSTAPGTGHASVLKAERIDIVDAQGRTVIAISNKARVAGPVVGGKHYDPKVADAREYLAGMVFFNEEGDEMGGLLFNSFRQPNGRVAGMGHLSFDRYGDNQVISLEHSENASGVRSGIKFYDRPATGDFRRSLDLVEESKTASTERRAEIKNELARIRASGGFGAERVFLGSVNNASKLELKDAKGLPRVRMVVDEQSAARLEFLDESGKVVAVYPDTRG